MEGKNGSVVLLLALVALCFYTGRCSARRSAIDFASPIQGEPICAVCAYIYNSEGYWYLYCLDEGPSCHENCQRCFCRFPEYCRCVDNMRSDQCKSFHSNSMALVEEIMLQSTPTSAHG